jgi:hypothetical protein
MEERKMSDRKSRFAFQSADGRISEVRSFGSLVIHGPGIPDGCILKEGGYLVIARDTVAGGLPEAVVILERARKWRVTWLHYLGVLIVGMALMRIWYEVLR